ncbi:MAG: hypothetical protein LBS20_05160 [Prevotella sp.]|nr:hypothetical protein [Prevotella sp.]
MEISVKPEKYGLAGKWHTACRKRIKAIRISYCPERCPFVANGKMLLEEQP